MKKKRDKNKKRGRIFEVFKFLRVINGLYCFLDYIYVPLYVCVCVCLSVWMCVCVCVSKCVNVWTYVKEEYYMLSLNCQPIFFFHSFSLLISKMIMHSVILASFSLYTIIFILPPLLFSFLFFPPNLFPSVSLLFTSQKKKNFFFSV